jgi:hypothetical protein
MGTGQLKVGAVSMTKRAVASKASGTARSMRNNQSFERCCGGVSIGGPSHMCFAVSEELTRNSSESGNERRRCRGEGVRGV